MSRVDDLLELAEHLAVMDSTRPKQASLQRAVSTTYYALFHELTQSAAKFLIGGRSSQRAALRAKVERCFEHGNMARASREFSRGRSGWLGADQSVSREVVRVCEAFTNLIQARHDADYSRRSFGRTEVAALIGQTRDAIAAWRRVHASDDAIALKVALLHPSVRQ